MNICYENEENFDSDLDYSTLKEKCQKLLKDKAKLEIQLKEKEIQLNEEKNKYFYEDADTTFPNYKKYDFMKNEYDKIMTEKLKQIEYEYMRKIKNLELEINSKTESSSAYGSLENSELVKISEEKNQLEELNAELKTKITELSQNIIKLEKENQYLNDVKKILKEKSKQNFELQDNLNNLTNSLKETEQKINSYKFLIADKDRYISTLLEENKNLQKIADNLKETGLDEINNLLYDEDRWREWAQLNELINQTVEQNSIIERGIISMKQTLNLVNFLKKTHVDFRNWMKKIYNQAIYLVAVFDEEHEISEFDVSKPRQLMLRIENMLVWVTENVINLKNDTFTNNKNNEDLENTRQKMKASAKVINEQTTLIGNLIKEMKRLKVYYKNQMTIIKEDLMYEKEKRLLQFTESEHTRHSLDCRINELEKRNKHLTDDNIKYQQENENLSNQLKFLVKQKILLSQQIEEYECHIMKNFNSTVFSEDQRLPE